MTQFEKKRFTVRVGERPVEGCSHGWTRPNGECQFCGKHIFAYGDYYTAPDGRIHPLTDNG